MKVRERPFPASKAAVYIRKAERFAHAARTLLDQGAWDPALSAAAHALICATDAVTIRHLGKRSSAQDHGESAGLLREVGTIPAAERVAVARHVEGVLAMKHLAEYEDRLVEEDEARRALQAMERAWPKLLRWAAEG